MAAVFSFSFSCNFPERSLLSARSSRLTYSVRSILCDDAAFEWDQGEAGEDEDTSEDEKRRRLRQQGQGQVASRRRPVSGLRAAGSFAFARLHTVMKQVRDHARASRDACASVSVGCAGRARVYVDVHDDGKDAKYCLAV